MTRWRSVALLAVGAAAGFVVGTARAGGRLLDAERRAFEAGANVAYLVLRDDAWGKCQEGTLQATLLSIGLSLTPAERVKAVVESVKAGPDCRRAREPLSLPFPARTPGR